MVTPQVCACHFPPLTLFTRRPKEALPFFFRYGMLPRPLWVPRVVTRVHLNPLHLAFFRGPGLSFSCFFCFPCFFLFPTRVGAFCPVEMKTSPARRSTLFLATSPSHVGQSSNVFTQQGFTASPPELFDRIGLISLMLSIIVRPGLFFSACLFCPRNWISSRVSEIQEHFASDVVRDL